MQKSEKLEKFLGLVNDEKSDLLEKLQWKEANIKPVKRLSKNEKSKTH
jgi:hypothetical protein